MTSVVLAGGGTAGHTSPLIATAQALKTIDSDVAITCVGTSRGLETRVIPSAGLNLELIDPVPIPRRLSLDLIKVPLRLTKAINQAKDILTKSSADVVVGFGGYVAAPVYLAARKLHIPVIVQEQNVKPGLANRLASRFAAAVLTSFPNVALDGANFVGLPLRRQIAGLAANPQRNKAKARARTEFGLPDGLVLLVSGGSQGARSLNNATLGAIDELLAKGVSILHVLGPKNFDENSKPHINNQTKASYIPTAFVDDMAEAYAAADLMLARSGAGTVVETAAVGLPTILVPLPIGNGEQGLNAKPVVDAGAGILVNDAKLSAACLVEIVEELMADSGTRLAEMSKAGQALMPYNAADRVAQIALETAGRSQK